jgi:hypothetical protein
VPHPPPRDPEHPRDREAPADRPRTRAAVGEPWTAHGVPPSFDATVVRHHRRNAPPSRANWRVRRRSFARVKWFAFARKSRRRGPAASSRRARMTAMRPGSRRRGDRDVHSRASRYSCSTVGCACGGAASPSAAEASAAARPPWRGSRTPCPLVNLRRGRAGRVRPPRRATARPESPRDVAVIAAAPHVSPSRSPGSICRRASAAPPASVRAARTHGTALPGDHAAAAAAPLRKGHLRGNVRLHARHAGCNPPRQARPTPEDT